MPVVQLADAGAVSKTASCLVASTASDRIQVGPLGGLVVAGDGNDTIIGSELRDTVLGDDGDDTITGALGSDHLDGGFGGDRIEGGDNSDFIIGGPGDDTIYGEQAEGTPAHPGNDIIHGGSGVDTIDGGPGADQIFGGVGADTLRGGNGDDTLVGSQGDDHFEGGQGRDWISGGAGNDEIQGGPGGDNIHPGMGRDTSSGGEGNDTFTIHGECEIEPGEVIDGGQGNDRIISALTEQELLDRGVKLVSIETFVQRYRGQTKPGEPIGDDTICSLQDPKLGTIEVSGTVVGSEVLLKNADGSYREPDGKSPGRWGAHTRYELLVDTVYLGDIQPRTIVPIVLPGGSVPLADGSSMSSSVCCFTALQEGRRYRLELRELQTTGGERSGWQYEILTELPINHSLVLPLAAHGPISLAMLEPPEDYGPTCPTIPRGGSFASNRKAINWSNTQGRRWDQSVDLCGGSNPCMIAAPTAHMDHNMTMPEGCADPETFRFVFGDAARIISNGGTVDGTWGVHPPGVSTNPAPLRACDTSQDDDGRNCIALDIAQPALGGASQQRDLAGFNGLTSVRERLSAKSMAWPTLQEAQEFDITLSHTIPHGDVCSAHIGSFSFSQLATHELGHAFGLGHVDDSCTVNMLESQAARWGAHEQARFRVLYPSHEFEFPDNLYVEP